MAKQKVMHGLVHARLADGESVIYFAKLRDHFAGNAGLFSNLAQRGLLKILTGFDVALRDYPVPTAAAIAVAN